MMTAEHYEVDIGGTQKNKEHIKSTLKLKLFEMGVLKSDAGKPGGSVDSFSPSSDILSFEQQKELLLLKLKAEQDHERLKAEQERERMRQDLEMARLEAGP